MDSRNDKGKGKVSQAAVNDDQPDPSQITLAEALTYKNFDETTLDHVVTVSTLQNNDSYVQAQQILDAFNEGVKDKWFTESVARGKRRDPGTFLLGAYNMQPMLVLSNKMIAKKLGALHLTDTIETRGAVNITDQFYGMHGRYVLNVPVNKYVLAKSGNKFLIYGPGPHVIKDPNFQFSDGLKLTDRDMVSMMSPHISHGTIHILRVPQGKYAAVYINGIPALLPPRTEPYVINTPNFSATENLFVDMSSPYIHHGNLHIVRVPAGTFAAITINGKPRLLTPNVEPYVYNTPYLTHDKNMFLDQSEPYIHYGSTRHILRVPQGKIARVWVNNQPELLEYQAEPYEYNTPYFKIDAKNDHDLFYDATDQLIIHGPIKRIIPHTGEVAITYDNGNLRVYPPTADSKAIKIESPTHEVSGFLTTNRVSQTFPSDALKERKRKENPKASADAINLVTVDTADSVQLGLCLLVVYDIVDPEKAIRSLSKDGIADHIEKLAIADIAKAIQRLTSQNFRSQGAGVAASVSGTQPPNYLQEVTDELARQLGENGIHLQRFNIESAKNLNAEIAAKMEEQALKLAELNAKEKALTQETKIILAESNQKAEAARIAREQSNAAIISTAKAELEAAELKNQMLIKNAEAAKQAAVLQGEAFSAHPELVQIRMAEIAAEAYAKSPVPMMMPQQLAAPLAPSMSAYGSPFTMFTAAAMPAQARVADDSRAMMQPSRAGNK